MTGAARTAIRSRYVGTAHRAHRILDRIGLAEATTQINQFLTHARAIGSHEDIDREPHCADSCATASELGTAKEVAQQHPNQKRRHGRSDALIGCQAPQSYTDHTLSIVKPLARESIPTLDNAAPTLAGGPERNTAAAMRDSAAPPTRI